MTLAVDEMFNKMQKLFGSSSEITSGFIDSLDEETINELINDTGSALNPKKIKSYMEKESASIQGNTYKEKLITKTYLDNKETSSKQEDYWVDISKYTNLYKINWQFLAAVDIVKYDSEDVSNNDTINTASSLYSTFSWLKGYTKDAESYKKTWTKTVKLDKSTGVETVVEDNSKKPTESKVVVKTPIAIPDVVKTAFGDYKYSVKENVVTSESSWSTPYILVADTKVEKVENGYEDDYTKPIYANKTVGILTDYQAENGPTEYRFNANFSIGVFKYIHYKYDSQTSTYFIYKADDWDVEGEIYVYKDGRKAENMPKYLFFTGYVEEPYFTGKYEQKKKYKDIVTTKYQYEISKTKVVEDIVKSPTFTFNPEKFLTFLGKNGLSSGDLELMGDILTSMPSTSSLIANVKKVIDGNYGNILDDISISDGNSYTTIQGGFNSAIPLFLQWDERWKNHAYSAESVGVAGCGVTSLSMVLTGLGADVTNLASFDYNKNRIFEPNEVADISTARGHSTNGLGTMQSLYKDVGEKLGLKVKETYSFEETYQALKEGKVAMVSVGPGTFTTGGHLMVLTGVDANGKLYLNDPYSIENSNKVWDASIIKSEADRYFIFDNPNYVVEEFEATSYYAYTFEEANQDGSSEAAEEALMQGGNTQTSTGLYVMDKDLRNKIIAVDPNMIPYKTKVLITLPDSIKTMTMPDGTKVSLDGWYSAEDTGGAINQRRIDVYMGAYKKSKQYKDLALQFGRRKITVKRLKKN